MQAVPIEQFTAAGRKVLSLAEEASRSLRHNYVGTEHILLGVLRQGGLAAQVLDSLDITPERVVTQVERIVGVGEEALKGRIPPTPLAKRLLHMAVGEARALGHPRAGPEHILLALMRENEGVAVRILLDFDAHSAKVRDEMLRLLQEAYPVEGEGSPDPTADLGGEQQAAPDSDRDELPEAIPTHSDRPATRDELGRARLAEVLAERMRRVRGEDTEAPVDTWVQRRRKRRHDAAAASRAGSFLVHLHAPWGAGKSSLLNFLARDLRNRGRSNERNRLTRFVDFVFRRRRTADPQLSRWIVVEFSAWEHQRLTAPWWWLLAAVHRSCARELWQISRIHWAWFWLRDIAWRLWNARAAVFATLLLIAALVLGVANDWFGLDVSSLTALQTVVLTVASALALATTLFGITRGAGRWLAIGSADAAVRFLRRAHDPLGVYRRRFRWLVRSTGHPITVFIDDLDRCRANYVVELLEGIQTIFAGEPVAYVVAADRTWVCTSFSQGYQDFENTVGEPGRPLGFLFLEKTFQISIEIPPMSSRDRARYWEALISGDGGQGAANAAVAAVKTDSETFANVASQAEVENRVKLLIGAGADDERVLAAAVRRLNAPDMQERLENLLSEFADLLENNPRSMKRLMNAYGIERDRLLRDGRFLTRTERRQLILLTILRLRWPLFADHLRGSPHEAEFCLPGNAPPADHPYADLFSDPEVRRLFDGSQAEERLAADLLADFPPPLDAEPREPKAPTGIEPV